MCVLMTRLALLRMMLFPVMHPACYVCTNIEIKITIPYNGPLYCIIIITLRRRAAHTKQQAYIRASALAWCLSHQFSPRTLSIWNTRLRMSVSKRLRKLTIAFACTKNIFSHTDKASSLLDACACCTRKSARAASASARLRIAAHRSARCSSSIAA